MQFDQGHPEVRHQLLVTLVHGTWPLGVFRTFFWTPPRRHRSPLWYEEGSPFLARLSTELHDIPHKIKSLLWTGANSIRIRDETAQALAKQLSAEHAEHPQATQLVIAHSHGGNIALRALNHLKQRDASSSCTESTNPLIVTLATPFIEVHQANFGRRPFWIRVALIVFFIAPFLGIPVYISLNLLFPQLFEDYDNLISATLFILFSVLIIWWWIVRRAPARQNKLDALKNATRLGEVVSGEPLLVIRAIDDEASLTLALGTIVNYVTARSIPYVLLLWVVLMTIIALVGEQRVLTWLPERALHLAIMGGIPALFGTLMVSRSVHGRELARSPMECQINTQSTPDAIGLSKIVTLVRRRYVKSLRHGIYDHEDCAKTISDWVRFRLETN
jgi:hypothetical protein